MLAFWCRMLHYFFILFLYILLFYFIAFFLVIVAVISSNYVLLLLLFFGKVCRLEETCLHSGEEYWTSFLRASSTCVFNFFSRIVTIPAVLGSEVVSSIVDHLHMDLVVVRKISNRSRLVPEELRPSSNVELFMYRT